MYNHHRICKGNILILLLNIIAFISSPLYAGQTQESDFLRQCLQLEAPQQRSHMFLKDDTQKSPQALLMENPPCTKSMRDLEVHLSELREAYEVMQQNEGICEQANECLAVTSNTCSVILCLLRCVFSTQGDLIGGLTSREWDHIDKLSLLKRIRDT